MKEDLHPGEREGAEVGEEAELGREGVVEEPAQGVHQPAPDREKSAIRGDWLQNLNLGLLLPVQSEAKVRKGGGHLGVPAPRVAGAVVHQQGRHPYHL